MGTMVVSSLTWVCRDFSKSHSMCRNSTRPDQNRWVKQCAIFYQSSGYGSTAKVTPRVNDACNAFTLAPVRLRTALSPKYYVPRTMCWLLYWTRSAPACQQRCSCPWSAPLMSALSVTAPTCGSSRMSGIYSYVRRPSLPSWSSTATCTHCIYRIAPTLVHAH